mmetsp:Transcript_42506/g.63061  ORF Transcript_42506/g.63061 Transcript_42506/m.63061 type:complete len:153 (-) Transcript_42506:472-930(-)
MATVIRSLRWRRLHFSLGLRPTTSSEHLQSSNMLRHRDSFLGFTSHDLRTFWDNLHTQLAASLPYSFHVSTRANVASRASLLPQTLRVWPRSSQSIQHPPVQYTVKKPTPPSLPFCDLHIYPTHRPSMPSNAHIMSCLNILHLVHLALYCLR